MYWTQQIPRKHNTKSSPGGNSRQPRCQLTRTCGAAAVKASHQNLPAGLSLSDHCHPAGRPCSPQLDFAKTPARAPAAAWWIQAAYNTECRFWLLLVPLLCIKSWDHRIHLSDFFFQRIQRRGDHPGYSRINGRYQEAAAVVKVNNWRHEGNRRNLWARAQNSSSAAPAIGLPKSPGVGFPL